MLADITYFDIAAHIFDDIFFRFIFFYSRKQKRSQFKMKALPPLLHAKMASRFQK